MLFVPAFFLQSSVRIELSTVASEQAILPPANPAPSFLHNEPAPAVSVSSFENAFVNPLEGTAGSTIHYLHNTSDNSIGLLI